MFADFVWAPFGITYWYSGGHFLSKLRTENNDDFVQELAFNSGADFFINFHQKPIVMELFIKNILKRKVKTKLNIKKRIYIDFESYLIFKEGKPFQLPRKEFMLFELLYNNSDKYFSKVDLAKIIWADESMALKRTIDVHFLHGPRILPIICPYLWF